MGSPSCLFSWTLTNSILVISQTLAPKETSSTVVLTAASPLQEIIKCIPRIAAGPDRPLVHLKNEPIHTPSFFVKSPGMSSVSRIDYFLSTRYLPLRPVSSQPLLQSDSGPVLIVVVLALFAGHYVQFCGEPRTTRSYKYEPRNVHNDSETFSEFSQIRDTLYNHESLYFHYHYQLLCAVSSSYSQRCPSSRWSSRAHHHTHT